MMQDTVSCIESGGDRGLVSAYQDTFGSWLVARGLWLFGYAFLFFRSSIYQYGVQLCTFYGVLNASKDVF